MEVNDLLSLTLNSVINTIIGFFNDLTIFK